MFISPDGWLRFPRPNEHAIARLLCFPTAGAEAFVYDYWAAFLPESLELCSIELPNRGSERETKQYKELSAMIAALAGSILRHSRQGQKLIFYGFCLGTFWAYEVACYLLGYAGLQPVQLIVAGFPAPHLRSTITLQMRTTAYRQLMTSYYPPGTPQHNYVLARFPSMIEDADLADQYAPPLETPLHCPLTVIGGWQDQFVKAEHFWSWQQYTTGNFRVQMFEGDHFFADGYQREFLQALTEWL